jgi:hypothetical protein
MDWVRIIGVKKYPCLELFHHVYNEGKRAPWKAKDLGILSGLPDYHLPVQTDRRFPPLYAGFWIEIKDTKKKPTKKQADIMSKLSDYDNYVCWSDNLDGAVQYVEKYCRWVHH